MSYAQLALRPPEYIAEAQKHTGITDRSQGYGKHYVQGLAYSTQRMMKARDNPPELLTHDVSYSELTSEGLFAI